MSRRRWNRSWTRGAQAGSVTGHVSDESTRIESYSNPLDEWHRLVKDPSHRVEYETSLRFLLKHLPSRGWLLDAGGGPGRCTIELARLGYTVARLVLTE